MNRVFNQDNTYFMKDGFKSLFDLTYCDYLIHLKKDEEGCDSDPRLFD